MRSRVGRFDECYGKKRSKTYFNPTDVQYLKSRSINISRSNKLWRKCGSVKLMLDEMYAGLKEYFETLGWEALTVQEVGLKSARDKDVVEYARKNCLLLVTQDQRPAELAELLGVKYVLISNAMIAKIADETIRRKYADIGQ